jgi:hypothetical protein
MDEDFSSSVGNILRYDIGTETNFTGQPTLQVDDSPPSVILNPTTDFVRDEDGTWWSTQFRFEDTKGVPSLTRWNDGNADPIFVSGRDPREVGDSDYDTDVDGADFLIWQRNNGIDDGSATVWQGDANVDGNVDAVDLGLWQDDFGNPVQEDLLTLDLAWGSIDIHDGLDQLILGGRSSKGVYVVDISDPSAPVVTGIIPQASFTRDAGFDIAGNVYVASSSSETLRIWSPGGDWIATTGSDGTFTLTQPLATAAVPEPSSLLIVMMGIACLAGGQFTSHRG